MTLQKGVSGSKLTFFKWLVDDAQLIKEQLSYEQAGELFLAVMDYVRDGTVVEVSPPVRWPYADYRMKVDRSREQYDKICAERAKNGAKGGKAKFEKAKAEAAKKVDFKPPTRKQFREAVDHYIEKDEIDESLEDSNYEVDSLYDELESNGWTLNNKPILDRNDWESIIRVRLSPTTLHPDPCSADRFYWSVYKQLYGMHKDAENFACTFCDELYDAETSTWLVNGKRYRVNEWEKALEAFVSEKVPP